MHRRRRRRRWRQRSAATRPTRAARPGWALRAKSGGGVYGGSLIESCAYNPTLNPLQAACIVWVAQGQGDFSEVRKLPYNIALCQACP